MSERTERSEAKTSGETLPTRLPPAGARRGGGPPWMNMGMPAEKSMTFGPSARRLMGRLRPYRMQLVGVVALAVVSVALSVVGPRILGRATDVIFAGVLGKNMHLPPGVSLDQAVQGARAAG